MFFRNLKNLLTFKNYSIPGTYPPTEGLLSMSWVFLSSLELTISSLSIVSSGSSVFFPIGGLSISSSQSLVSEQSLSKLSVTMPRREVVFFSWNSSLINSSADKSKSDASLSWKSLSSLMRTSRTCSLVLFASLFFFLFLN